LMTPTAAVAWSTCCTAVISLPPQVPSFCPPPMRACPRCAVAGARLQRPAVLVWRASHRGSLTPLAPAALPALPVLPAGLCADEMLPHAAPQQRAARGAKVLGARPAADQVVAARLERGLAAAGAVAHARARAAAPAARGAAAAAALLQGGGLCGKGGVPPVDLCLLEQPGGGGVRGQGSGGRVGASSLVPGQAQGWPGGKGRAQARPRLQATTPERLERMRGGHGSNALRTEAKAPRAPPAGALLKVVVARYLHLGAQGRVGLGAAW
jgi:hypothetical protein